jgi:AraC-like DNA-binding protein
MDRWQRDWKEIDGVLPELRSLLWKRPRTAWRGQYGDEVRHHRWTLVMRLRGGMTVNWQDERLEVPGGHALLIPPGVRNGAEAEALTPGTMAVVGWSDGRLPGLDPATDRTLRTAIARLPRVIPGPPAAEALVLDLLEAAHQPAGALRTWACRTRLHRFLQALLAAAPQRPPLPPRLAQALARFHPDAPTPTVAALARGAGMDRAAFTRLCSAALGEAPAAWMRRQRIQQAQHLLRGGTSVTATALRLGFSSSQHLADAFRRAVGIPPTAWLARVRAGAEPNGVKPRRN